MWHERAWEWGGVQCGEMGEKETLIWSGHIERIENEEFVKEVYRSTVEGPSRRGRPLGRWEDGVKDYVSERGVRGNGTACVVLRNASFLDTLPCLFF